MKQIYNILVCRKNKQHYDFRNNRKASKEIQQKFSKLTGLQSDIVNCNEMTLQTMWIDNMTDALMLRYNILQINNKTNIEIFSLLQLFGFSEKYLFESGIYKKNGTYMMTPREIIKILLQKALDKIDSLEIHCTNSNSK